MNETATEKLHVLNSWSALPKFKSEKEEVKFWEEHTIAPHLMNASLHQSDVRESTTVTLRFDPRLLSRIKRIARSRYLNYQSMIKQWLSERLEQETHHLK